jgi:hypothetical protein
MLRAAGQWISRLKDEATQASFVEERHEAYVWTHRQVMARASTLFAERLRGFLGNAEATALVTATSDLDDTGIDSRLSWLQGRLDDGGLLLSPTIVDANNHYAVAVVLGRMMGSDQAQSEHYWRLAAMHRHRANSLLASVAFRIDAGDAVEPDPLDPEDVGTPATVLALGPV